MAEQPATGLQIGVFSGSQEILSAQTYGTASFALLRSFVLFVCAISVASCSDEIFGDAVLDDGMSAHQALTRFHPELGIGVNEDESQTFRRCVTDEKSDIPATFESRDFQQTSISNRAQLTEKLSIDTAVAARGLWGGVSASVNSLSELTFSDDSFYWLVYSKYDLGMKGLDTGHKNFGLTDEAKKILSEGGLEAFNRACGTSFYSGIRRGGRYGLLYEFSSHDEKSTEKLKAMASYEGFGVKASAEFERILSMASQSRQLKVFSYIQGGGKDIAEYAMEPDKLIDELSKLRSDLLVDGRGVAVEWSIQNYDIFPEILAAKRGKGFSTEFCELGKRSALEDFYGLFMRNRDRIASYRSAISKANSDEPLYGYSDIQKRSINEAIEALTLQNMSIDSRARKCLRDEQKKCDTSGLPEVLFSAPKPEYNFNTLQNWEVKLRKKTPSSTSLNFEATHVETGEVRRFNTHQMIRHTGLGVLLSIENLKNAEAIDSYTTVGDIIIGTWDQIPDPITGNERPNICIYATSNHCSIRMVEMISEIDRTQGSVVKLQISMYDRLGILLPDKIEFTQDL